MRLAISFSREKFSHHKDHEENIFFVFGLDAEEQTIWLQKV
jgi:hypothetical protein